MTGPASPARLPRSRLRAADVLPLGLLGIRGRPARAALSGLGIAIGIACVVAVLGISASSQAGLLAQIDALGTDLLTVQPGKSLTGEEAKLPAEAPAMIGRLPGVRATAHVGRVDGGVYRHDRMPAGNSGGISILAASLGLPATLGVPVVSGSWLNPATERYPAAVLGSAAARRLGVTEVRGSPQLFLAGQWFTVVGVLGPAVLDPAVDSAVLVGVPVAVQRLGFDGLPTRIYQRSAEEAVTRVRDRLPMVANPANPSEVEVSRPSDALVARAAAEAAYTGLFLGLGAVALLVGCVGIANVMVIGVLERRGEIGLRRALGATRAHVRRQFLTESVLLSVSGGAVGAVIGAGITIGYAAARDWAVVVPVDALAGGLVGSLLAGALAGLYPAARAARMSPTEALRAG
ncbi:ABC transporter permease [Plantactinospora sp. BB1]|uniref:ABC transporter permease n=1 Tax=Plantactinospora sp. BB1 TaxID=2071627 RepID=UPI000D159E91|nr:ABC transporter permease [Plantactinospora sp. BB1]AVT39718.1 ABC transporter permease [Plantactinospora sp. BB1]